MRKFIYIFTVILIKIVLSSCDALDKVDYFIVKVDSLTAPDTISTDDTLEIKLSGTIGPDGCHSFDRFVSSRYSHKLELSVCGKKVHSVACPAMVVPLDTTYRVIPPFEPGTFRIEIIQPKNIESLHDSVWVINPGN